MWIRACHLNSLHFRTFTHSIYNNSKCCCWKFLWIFVFMNTATTILCILWEEREFNGHLASCKPTYLQNYFTELEPTHFNSAISNSLLFLTQNYFPWIHLSVIYSGLFWTPAISNYFLFPNKVRNSGVQLYAQFLLYLCIKPWRIYCKVPVWLQLRW